MSKPILWGAGTPGPWQNNGIDLIDGGPRFGASLFTTQVGEPICDAEMYANCRAIAEVPSLVLALRLVLPVVRDAIPKFDWGNSALDAAAIAALAKLPSHEALAAILARIDAEG